MRDRLRRSRGLRLWWASHRPYHAAFRRAIDRPRAVQTQRLLEILRRNAASRYGRRHRFDLLRSVGAFQDAVPIVTYEDLAPWIESVKAGQPGVLTTEPVLFVERTSGSTDGAKLIPYTRGLLREFRHAVGAWMGDLCEQRPALRDGRAYWALSPIAQPDQRTAGGLRVGAQGDSDYFPPAERPLIRSLLVVPEVLQAVRDVETHRYLTLRWLLAASDLTWASVWNPSFLALLIRSWQGWEERLTDDIRRGTLTPPTPLPSDLARRLSRSLTPNAARARELQTLRRESRGWPVPLVWPRLQFLSCWASAEAARGLPDLHTLVPHAEIQGKGLLATEGVVSIPLMGQTGAALSITAHFYEFLEVGASAPQPRLVDELEEGGRYTVLLTTSGGLYRYRLDDTIEVVGRVGRTPLVEFVGRASGVSDLCGEKLDERLARIILEDAWMWFGFRPRFAMLAPEWGEPPAYALLLQAPGLPDERLAELVEWVEDRLLGQPHYAYCRRLGQLGPLRGFRIDRDDDATSRYLTVCEARGQRIGTIKPVALHRATGWTGCFRGAWIQREQAHVGAL